MNLRVIRVVSRLYPALAALSLTGSVSLGAQIPEPEAVHINDKTTVILGGQMAQTEGWQMECPECAKHLGGSGVAGPFPTEEACVVQYKIAISNGFPYSQCHRVGGAAAASSNADQMLRVAVNNKNLEQVQAALNDHANTETKYDDGYFTPLMAAVWLGQADIVKLLLDHHANIEARAANGTTSLIAAAQPGASVDVVRLLLANHANIEATNDSGTTPLLLAAHHGNIDVARLLIDAHANLEAVNKLGMTPLQMAAEGGQTEMVKLLLTSHANEAAKTTDGMTAIDIAATNLRCDTVLVLEHGTQSRTMACLQALVNAYQAQPRDELLDTELHTRLAMKPLPSAVPQEARRPFVQANDVFKNSQGDADAQKAIALYKQALLQAPWFAEAWNNLSLAQEKVGDYKGAASSLKNFTLVHPEAANDQATLDHIYLLEGKAK